MSEKEALWDAIEDIETMLTDEIPADASEFVMYDRIVHVREIIDELKYEYTDWDGVENS